MGLKILLTFLLVLINGFFVAAEFAFVKVRLSQIEIKAQGGNRLAKLVESMLHDLNYYLSATQLGITLASLALGWIGESVVAEVVMAIIHQLNITVSDAAVHKIALFTSFTLITVLHIVLGEQAPKVLAIQKPETTSMAIAIPLRAFAFVTFP
ncbi:CNNM domain-containing protein [Hymenobacter cellulosilyticus]|uniref:CNNM domain-containing protein n=1 Tax=Hymenobacter cellulosilyticus TaxID=2932248 RepID=A0A8T9Q9N9_9BACT|nr:CNNM domain-containing protein [Hymenobacter cellulosilyticus]UOQ72229.1 CNNM domain-containing protein [Hymenobacter cellulosilyticus]